MKYKVGLVLGGGGSRGFAHLGIIKALKEKGIVPDIISGVSAGAIAGSLIADGKSPEEAFKIIKSKGFSEYTRIRIPRKGFFSLDGLRKELEKSYTVNNLEDLQIPFFAVVTNFSKGIVEYYNKGILSDFVIASASIPIMFEPVLIDDEHFVDGGLLDNLPFKPLQNICEKIIAINLVPVIKTEKIKGMKHIIARTLDLAVNCKLPEVKEVVDLLIEPPELRHQAFFSTKSADEVFEIGYKSVIKMNLGDF
jgi:NTE family protein